MISFAEKLINHFGTQANGDNENGARGVEGRNGAESDFFPMQQKGHCGDHKGGTTWVKKSLWCEFTNRETKQ